MAAHVEWAMRWHERMRGLLGRKTLGTDAALVIGHCNAVHTLGMRFALDLIFLDGRDQVVRIVRNVKPGCVCIWGGWQAKRVIEAEAGCLDLTRLAVGETLEITETHRSPRPG